MYLTEKEKLLNKGRFIVKPEWCEFEEKDIYRIFDTTQRNWYTKTKYHHFEAAQKEADKLNK